MRRFLRGSVAAAGLGMACFVLVWAQPVWAVTSKSPNFEVSETEFGAGAALNTCSGSYCAQATIGSTTNGEGSSANYAASFSPLEDNSEPSLELFVEPGKSDLGQLDIDRTATRTMVLNVRSYLAGGYTVQITGTPPQFEGYTLDTPTTPTASQVGSEQFGLNIVANTSPSIGQDPISSLDDKPVPGVAMPAYSVPNMFMYSDGDVVARTLSESSQIRYTVSMIVNVGGTTPAGHYAGDFSAVVTPVF